MSALDDAASLDIWAHGELQRMKEELNHLRAENEALKQERDKWHHRARMLWEGYLLTEQMSMPEIERWFRDEVSQ